MVQSAHNVFLLVAPTVRDRDAWAAAIAHQVGDEEHGKRTPISVGKSEVAHVLWPVRARQVTSRQQHTIARRPSAHHVQALTVMPKSQVEKLRARAHIRYVYLLGFSPVLFRGPPARNSKIN